MLGKKMMRDQVLKSTLIFLFIIYGVISSPPGDPIQCSSKNTDCTITNSLGAFPDRSICKVAEAHYPTTEEELISIVASASKSNRKMKVATRYSHSIPKLACPGDKNGLLISTNNLTKIVKIDVEARTMTVESGVLLRNIISEAAKAGLALPYTPYWWGITIGGLLATGAHGSTLWGKGSAVHDYVIELRIVTPAGPEDGYAKVRTLNESDQDLNAAKVSLGVLGAVSQVTLQLEPLFKRSIEFKTKSDSDLGDELVKFGRKYEFGDVTWYPRQGKAVYRIDYRVPINTTGDGLFDFIPFQSTASAVLTVARGIEDLQEALGSPRLKCISADLITTALALGGYGLRQKDGKGFKRYPVVGFNNRMQSSGTCLDSSTSSASCAWDPRINGKFYHQTAFSIPLSQVKYFIEDVQKLVKSEKRALCGLEMYNGIILRYVTASSAYLGKTEDAVDFDITYYRRRKDPSASRLFEDIIEEIEQMGLFKYGASPHWGKNRNLAFVGAIKKYPNANKFLKVKDKFDPKGLFSSEWTDQVLGIKEGLTTITDKGCASEGLCRCSQDSHCASNLKCSGGRVFKEARVCVPKKAVENESYLLDKWYLENQKREQVM